MVHAQVVSSEMVKLVAATMLMFVVRVHLQRSVLLNSGDREAFRNPNSPGGR